MTAYTLQVFGVAVFAACVVYALLDWWASRGGGR